MLVESSPYWTVDKLGLVTFALFLTSLGQCELKSGSDNLYNINSNKSRKALFTRGRGEDKVAKV